MTGANGRLPPMTETRIVLSDPEVEALATLEGAMKEALGSIVRSRGADPAARYRHVRDERGIIRGIASVPAEPPPAPAESSSAPPHQEGAAPDGLPADATEPAPAERSA